MILPMGSPAVASGLLLGGASILSLGPNNLMLMREGLVGGRTVTVATAVWGSDLALGLAALALAGCTIRLDSDVGFWLSWGGVVVIGVLAARSLRAALRFRTGTATGFVETESGAACLRRVLATVWLNPLSYLERLMLPAVLCGGFATFGDRLLFVGALAAMAALCCYGYALGGAMCAAIVRHRRTLQIFDAASASLLAGGAVIIAVRLARAG